jgi:hypothetical protein
MKTPPDNPEFRRFTEAMKAIMGVSKAELNERIKAEKDAKKGKRSKASSPSASPSVVSSSTLVH